MKIKQTTHQQSAFSGATCPLCTLVSTEILARQLRRGNGMVRYCPACEHGYLIQEQAVDAKEYYGELYRREYSHNAEAVATNPREIHEVYKNYQRDRLHHISPHLTAGSRLLEVGASAGQFLVHIKEKVGEVNAIELDNTCGVFLRNELGIEVDTEFLENSRFAGRTYDVVCAFQVIEHVEQPVTFLKTLRHVTKKDGLIFIEAPNLHDPLLAAWDVPTYQKFFYHSAHLHYFTEASLRKVARDAGFRSEQIEIIFTQDYNVLNHLHWIMNDGPQSDCHVGLSEIDLRGPNQEIAAWLTEQMRVVNQKYIAKLTAAKLTSNMLMKLRND
jgi:2-polyprenyl-3-methyl-5-hydroxy-6-metoxy-1,4-benzoquinol methylase